MPKEFHLEGSSWPEVCMTALGSKRAVAASVPVENRLSQAGPCRNDRSIGLFLRKPWVEGRKLAGIELQNPVSRGFEIVDQRDRIEIQATSDFPRAAIVGHPFR